MKKRWVFMALFTASVMGAIYYNTTQSLNKNDELPSITASLGTIEKQAVAVGQIVPAHSISIKSQIDGIVGEIYHQVGDYVTVGTPLIKVRPNPTPAALTLANTGLMRSEAMLESALQKLDNLKQLVSKNIIPKNYGEYIQARSDVKSSQADVQQKKQNFDLIRSGESSVGESKLTSTITAPINGTILNLKVEIGEPITSTESSQAATEMMSVADMKDMIFKGSVSEHDAAQLKVGTPVNVILAPYPGVVMKGMLSKVAVQSEMLNSTTKDSNQSFDNGFQVEVGNIQFPQDITIRSGFSATAKIILKQVSDVVTIPERVLNFNGEIPEVWIPDESESGYSAREVKLGLSDGIIVEVLSGLENGEAIIDISMMMGASNE
ncbi:efflux RND transporter periplasmic adaptor subunit [Moritella viscosa]|uniref:Periplasmic component of efflux system n=1 Tax=Moritella viscosa TaxID=80854 RepID=A0ABY1HJJ4_9GAMM|nr:efflux RND transporter periplasmic adaptor subunit [Moritella viscosa]SGY96232.1 Periplasmic component of efflux system [Moritella viscosa]SGZ01827.1 Periplasmic component of efflux system [Moritella viscosa]SGZ08785.1 Periplasmic component of efflux system [Moritella viscosa]SHO10587.1 Periplasmic component of efflux system [Moritella viscosa]SHO15758.1 Periplasmic component of efflux system [Moritella viscosa]